jgi:hypothetical protein
VGLFTCVWVEGFSDLSSYLAALFIPPHHHSQGEEAALLEDGTACFFDILCQMVNLLINLGSGSQLKKGVVGVFREVSDPGVPGIVVDQIR